MRSRDEVLDKFHEMRDNKLREMKERFLCRSHINCRHNARMKVHSKGQAGFCQNPEVLSRTKNGMFVCNEDDTARRCRVYCCRNTDESVESLFNDVLKSPARCGEMYPKLVMLIWFLQEIDGSTRSKRLGYLFRQLGSLVWKILTFRWL